MCLEPAAALHATKAVIDGLWSTVGSANLDYRSLIHNDEANAFVISPRFARQMQAMFEGDLQRCTRIHAGDWRRRPWRQPLLEAFAGAIKWLL